jgi:hypothetical protein
MQRSAALPGVPLTSGRRQPAAKAAYPSRFWSRRGPEAAFIHLDGPQHCYRGYCGRRNRISRPRRIPGGGKLTDGSPIPRPAPDRLLPRLLCFPTRNSGSGFSPHATSSPPQSATRLRIHWLQAIPPGPRPIRSPSSRVSATAHRLQRRAHHAPSTCHCVPDLLPICACPPRRVVCPAATDRSVIQEACMTTSEAPNRFLD